tara:strand:+ start:193 stop:819 length:627 start_codon:yes stop_codon:yes gene_type:complete
MTTSIQASDTELSAVNSILGSIGQSPITALPNGDLNLGNPEVALIHNLLMECNKDVQNEGWHFNKEDHVKVERDANGQFLVPSDYLRMDIHEGQVDRNRDVVIRNGKIYDNVLHTDVFTKDFFFDITRLYNFVDVPPVFQRYIIACAAVRAATQLVSNTELVKLLTLNQTATRATATEYDCEMGDHTFLGWPHESSYRSYQPYKALAR